MAVQKQAHQNASFLAWLDNLLSFLIYFIEWIFKWGNVIISYRLVDLSLLVVVFAFGRWNMFDVEILASSALSTLLSDGEIF
jgi:hypothetical protein